MNVLLIFAMFYSCSNLNLLQGMSASGLILRKKMAPSFEKSKALRQSSQNAQELTRKNVYQMYAKPVLKAGPGLQSTVFGFAQEGLTSHQGAAPLQLGWSLGSSSEAPGPPEA